VLFALVSQRNSNNTFRVVSLLQLKFQHITLYPHKLTDSCVWRLFWRLDMSLGQEFAFLSHTFLCTRSLHLLQRNWAEKLLCFGIFRNILGLTLVNENILVWYNSHVYNSLFVYTYSVFVQARTFLIYQFQWLSFFAALITAKIILVIVCIGSSFFRVSFVSNINNMTVKYFQKPLPY
jgi:hypothetical protein